MKRLTLSVAVAVGAATAAFSFGTAAVWPAHADDQDGYIAYLQNHGMSRQSISEGELVTAGEAECQEMRKGRSEYDLTHELEAYKSNAESSAIVSGAHRYLCPDAPVAYSTNLPKR